MYFVRTPQIVKPLYRDLIWNIPTSEKVVYLTFDDGPTPSITDETLAILDTYSAKATFFLLGKNVKSNPEYLNKYSQAGHRIGNHSFSHLNGWKTATEEYLSDVEDASALINTQLFRPPYGRIKREQSKLLSEKYRIIMWDVLAGDFDTTVTSENCINNVVGNVESGSIVVLHDSVKAAPRMLKALPEILRQLTGEGYSFRAIPTSF